MKKSSRNKRVLVRKLNSAINEALPIETRTKLFYDLMIYGECSYKLPFNDNLSSL